MNNRVGFLLTCVLLSSCSHQIQNYSAQSPKFVINEYFNGSLEAHGIVQDYTGLVTRHFKADIQAKWKGDNGILDELFYFSDGEQSRRCWRLTKKSNVIEGSAGDVIGLAKGEIEGNALNWQYTLLVPIDSSNYEFELDDWLFLVDKDNMINRTEMKWNGLTVGNITLSIRKRSEQPEREFSADCRLEEQGKR
jgi:hypothetical protein